MTFFISILFIRTPNKSWRRGLVFITTAQLHSTKPEIRFCTGSNPVHGVSEFGDGRISDNGSGWK